VKNKFVRKLLRSYTRQCYYEAITNRSEGEISIGEARFLGSLISNLKTSGPIVEIGTHLGFSTLEDEREEMSAATRDYAMKRHTHTQRTEYFLKRIGKF
jgi:predicted O-methyltransferase YrrM